MLVCTLFNHRVYIPFKDPEFDEAAHHDVHSSLMGLIKSMTSSADFNSSFVGSQYHLIQRLLRICEAAIDGPGAGYVCSVVLILATGVDQHQIAIL